jgi:hypothetical protein
MDFNSIDSIKAEGFTGFVKVDELRLNKDFLPKK